MKELNTVFKGDCLHVLKTLPSNSVDSIVTDPPYELGFMGKAWDSTGIANNKEMWAECLRVLKPGGHLLAFSGTRTYHRMASAIEDAGFEVRDMIEWVYGSGFPKSLNIGKAVDKIAPRLGQFDEFAKHLTEQIKKSGKSQKEIALLFPSKTGGITGCVWNWANGANVPTVAQWNILKPLLDLSDDFLPLIERIERERKVVGKGEAGFLEKNSVFEMDNKGYGSFDLTKGTSEWEGWGTALKPAHEPICMARKPLSEKTVAENVLKWGTGGINIDESRVEAKPRKTGTKATSDEATGSGNTLQGSSKNRQAEYDEQNLGRFPANLILEDCEEVRECFPDAGKGNGKGAYNYAGREYDNKNTSMFNGDKPQAPSNFNDSGNASRFFKSIIYQAKASKSERNKGCEGLEEKVATARMNASEFRYEEGREPTPRAEQSVNKNNHPTVKPIALMEYLIKMVTKPGGIVLDPFAGSGSTLVAAKQNGFNYIGIEKEQEYIDIINKRLA